MKSNHNLEFRYAKFVIDIVDFYVYLGVNFNNIKSGSKSLLRIEKTYKYELMDIETMLELFDAIVIQILLYGSEVWGFENISNVEKIRIRFY